MIPVSTLANTQRATDLNSSLTSTVLYHAQRNTDGEITNFCLVMLYPPALELWARPQHELVGGSISQLFTETDAQFLIQQFSVVVTSGRSVRFEMEYRWQRDGSLHLYDVLVTKLEDGVLVNYGEISPSAKIERALEQQTDLLQKLLRHSPCLMEVLEAVRDKDGKIEDFIYRMVNGACLEKLELTEEQVIGQRMRSLFPETGPSGVFDRLVAVVETGETYQQEIYDKTTTCEYWTDTKYIRYNDGVIALGFDLTAIRLAEKKYQEQAELYKTILNTALTSITVLDAVRDANGKIVDLCYTLVSQERLRVAGQPESFFIGKKLTELYPGMLEAGVFARWVEVIETRKAQQFEVHYTYDGYDDWSLCLGTPFGDGLVVSYTDITKQKQAELQARQQSIILQQVIDNSQAGLVLARPERNESGSIIDFRYVLTNEYNARITGRSVADMTDALVSDLYPGWQDSDFFRRYVEVVESGQTQRVTFLYEDYNITGWFDGSFSTIEGCLLYTYTDVTPLKEAELAQQQYASLLEQVMNMTPAAIVLNESIRDETGAIVDFRMTKLNQMAADLMQHPIEKIQYRRVSKFIPGSVDTPLFNQCKQVVQTGEPTRLEVPWADHWYDFSLVRFGDGIVLAAQDITAMREYQEKLERANLELNRSNENLQSFAFVSSHDLQEPLRKIISFADMLTTQYAGQFDTDATDIITRINASANRMRLLIQDLLAYSQVDTRQDLFTPVNLTRLIQELQEHELWMSIQQTRAEIHLDKLPTLMADSLQMRQLFQNLLSNAIKFCPKGVTPAITVSSRLVNQADLPDSLMLSAIPEKRGADAWFSELSITDNGIGFDEKYLDRIFQVFQRLHGKSQYAGSGIGLAICYKIVERHGGVITASSRPGVGSTFRVYLPFRKGSA